MKPGKNLLGDLIDTKIEDAISGIKTLYVGQIVKVAPLTVQPLAKTAEGEKRVPITDCRQLDFGYYLPGAHDDGHTRELKVGDDVLVGVVADSLENYTKGKDFIEDQNRRNSIDSSIVLGVIR